MPLKLADLAKKTKAVVMEYEGEAVNLVVRHQLVTPHAIASLTDLAGISELDAAVSGKVRALAEEVARLVAKWDLQGLDGKAFPLVAERLAAEVPIAFLGQVLMAAIGAVRGDAGEGQAPGDSASGPTSGAPSSPTA